MQKNERAVRVDPLPALRAPWGGRLAAVIVPLVAIVGLVGSGSAALAAATAPSTDAPVFVDGQAQVVEAFGDARNWVRESLFVETEFD